MIYILKINKKLIIFTIFLLFFVNIFSYNFYEEYKKAEKHYKNNNFESSLFILRKIINKYPDYDQALILKLKAEYLLKNNIDEELFLLIDSDLDEDLKEDFFNFFLKNNDLSKTEVIYNSLENKENFKYNFINFLYLNKEYKKILNKYQDKDIIKLIEKSKEEADKKYYQALDLLKKNNVEKSIELLLSAIDVYPINYVYYYKLAEVYADKKNHFLAEEYIKKALRLYESEEMYYTLYKLYKEINNQSKMFSISKKLLNKKEVRRDLKKIYKKEKENKGNLRILKISKNRLYIDKRYIETLEIGDTFTLKKVTENIYDPVTGEILGREKEKIAKIRLFKFEEKVAIFYIIENYRNIDVRGNYIIS